MGTKLYTYLDEEGRILSVTNADFHDGAVEYEYPDDFDVMSIGDYRIVDGALEYTGEATAAREEAEREAQAEAERKQAIDEGCQAFFLDGGKTEMEKAIEDAAASGGGADPQVAVMARLLAPSIDFATVTATDVVAIPDYVPAWEDVSHFEQNDPCTYEGTIYRASQPHDRQDIYPPDVAGESMYYPIEVAPDGVIVYRTCHGDYDKVRKGERRHYPGADDPVYEALEDTAYAPDVYPQHWKLVSDADTE